MAAEYAFKNLDRLKLTLNEGLAVSLLNLFSKYRRVELCEKIVRSTLPNIMKDFPIREWHLAPLVTAYTATGRMEDAIRVFAEIRDANIQQSTLRRYQSPIAPSYTAFLDAFASADDVQRGMESLNRILDADTGDVRVPVELVNAVLKACVLFGLTPELRSLDKRIFNAYAEEPSTAVIPDITTFNILLSANLPLETSNPPGAHSADVTVEQIVDAQRLMEMLKTDFVYLAPTLATYTSLAESYVRGPAETWELAFDYLEEMKHFDMAPPAKLYLGILNRLVTPPPGTAEEDAYLQSRAEDRRITLILQEMAALGYLGRLRGRDGGRSILSRDMRSLVGEERIEHVLQNLYKGRPQDRLRSQTAAQQRRQQQDDKWSHR